MPASKNIDQKFFGIWQRAQSSLPLNALTPDLLASWAHEKNISTLSVKERKVGPFHPIDCIVMNTADGAACFPKTDPRSTPHWAENLVIAQEEADLWEKVEWFAPLWVSNGKCMELLAAVKHASKQRAIDLFDYHMSTVYTLAFQAVCIEQILPAAHSLKEFIPIAREAYLAFYSGYKASAISSLIPVIEGAISRIQRPLESGSLIDKIDRTIEKSIKTAADIHYEGMWTPAEYKTKEFLFAIDERVFFFETFQRWLKASFFKNTGEYDGITWLNRHIFAHATTSHWHNPTNFSRPIVAIATLAVVESWYDNTHLVSFMLPEMDKASTLLWEQGKFRTQTQFALLQIEEELYHRNGCLVPTLPADNGVLLRTSILMDTCMNDLVRPLREAGWSAVVGEPTGDATYVIVTAASNREEINVALLYSCATDNSIYKELDKTCQAILYRGAPYHQDSYAYGIKTHVGPVLGWQPPKA